MDNNSDDEQFEDDGDDDYTGTFNADEPDVDVYEINSDDEEEFGQTAEHDSDGYYDDDNYAPTEEDFQREDFEILEEDNELAECYEENIQEIDIIDKVTGKDAKCIVID